MKITLQEVEIPKILKDCIFQIINYNFEPFRKIVFGINKDIKEEAIREVIDNLQFEKIILLPENYMIAGHTDYSGRIYIYDQLNKIIENLKNKNYNDLDEDDFYLLAVMIREIGHLLKIEASKTLNSSKNQANPFIRSPRECILFEDENKLKELYPEAGCYLEIEIFGSVIESGAHLESSDNSHTASENAQILFQKIKSKEKINTILLKNMKIRIAMNKHFGYHHPYEIRHILMVNL